VKAEDLASHPDIKSDERDASYLRNVMKRSRRLQRIKVKEFVFLYDPETREVFDHSAFADNERLLKLGVMKTNKIEFFTYE
jgi:hypothetical protein